MTLDIYMAWTSIRLTITNYGSMVNVTIYEVVKRMAASTRRKRLFDLYRV